MNDFNGKFLVVLLTYNRRYLLEQTINSVLNSSSNNYQLVVLDNASTDGTSEYLAELEKMGRLVHVRHAQNIGMGGNANYAINNLAADYLMMLHDDDIIDVHYISNIQEFVSNHDEVVMIGTGYKFIDSLGAELSHNCYHSKLDNSAEQCVVLSYEEYFSNHLNGLSLPWSGTTFNFKLIKGFKFDFDKYKYAADAVFMLEILQRYNVGYIPKILFSYRVHQYSTTAGFNLNKILAEWNLNFTYYRNYIIANGLGNDLLLKHTRSTTLTLLSFVNKVSSFAELKLILTNEFFAYHLLTFKQKIKLIKSILMCCLGKLC